MAEERQQAQVAANTAERDSLNIDNHIPVNSNGYPLIRISVSAAELIPTRQYANIVVGPITVVRYIDPQIGITDEEKSFITKEIHETQKLCEQAVAEDRETVHNMIRQSEQGRLIP
jgi:hypothetical protein